MLSPEIAVLTKHHLAACEFCRAEVQLLVHYTPPTKGECKAPELPINLRILAESILHPTSGVRKTRSGKIRCKNGFSLN
jgi:hypothetical protein